MWQRQLAGSANNCAAPLMTEHAADLFDAVSPAYASHRPTYPPAFFQDFAERCAARHRVWDCGCGNGQASMALAEQFDQVVATDASTNQVQQAAAHPRIVYRAATATESGLESASVDAILVAQAVHWFAGEAFNAEVRRVARPGAVMAWIGYRTLQWARPDLQKLLDDFYSETLKPWWPPQRRWVDQSFAGLPFPGEEWPFPQNIWIERHWTLPDLVGYLSSWSAVEQARRGGQDPLPALVDQLLLAWPNQGREPVLGRWPFMGRWRVIGS